MTFVWAYVAGLLTLINPCVLPLLPIIIASALQTSRMGPAALAAGLVISFTVFGVTVTAFGHLIGLHDYVLNQIAAVIMILFGLALLVPQANRLFSRLATPFANTADTRIGRLQNNGLTGQATIGVLLGAVWSPCIGPTLGGAIGLAASGDDLAQAAFTMLVFGFGVATVLLALAYGSREVLASRQSRLRSLTPWARPIMAVTLLLVGVTLFLDLDKYIEIWLLDVMPVWLQDLSVRF